MEFSWTKEDQALHRHVQDFAQEHLNVDTVQRDLDNKFSTELWQRCAREGILGWATPKALGGAEHSALECAFLLDALGFGCEDNGLLFALGTQMWGVQSCLLQYGSDEQKQRYIPAMLAGDKIGAYAINEPDSGSDAYSLTTTAVEDGDSYIIQGTKSLISMATVADFAIVFAITNPEAGRWGISAFIVDSNTPGFSTSNQIGMMGLRTVPFGNIELNACRVPKSCLLGELGAGAGLFAYSQAWERSLMLAPHVGTMRRQLEQCISFSKKRKLAKQSISKHQAVSHRLVNMRIRIEASQLMVYKTAWLLAQRKQNLMEAAMTKTYVSEAFVESSEDAISLQGGSGYLSENGVERNLRDALGGTIYGGTVDIQRNIIAGLLGL